MGRCQGSKLPTITYGDSHVYILAHVYDVARCLVEVEHKPATGSPKGNGTCVRSLMGKSNSRGQTDAFHLIAVDKPPLPV